MKNQPGNPFESGEKRLAASQETSVAEKDRAAAKALVFFAQRGTAIFNCAEAWLLHLGYGYEDLDRVWSLVKIPWRQDRNYDYWFEDLIRDLRENGNAEAAAFAQAYFDNGYPEKGLRAYLQDHGIPEETFDFKSGKNDESTSAPQATEPEPPQETKEKIHVMNLLTNREAVVQALIEMEGKDWYERHQPSWGENSIDGALHAAQHRVGRGIIYGVGGWHRYAVDENGNVSYIGNKGVMGIDKARALGFEII